MSETIVILVNGEVLAGERGVTIPDQKENARKLAESLLPILASPLQVVVLHGNKPQVGFVLLRSEIASHALHKIPLDICGADTQGATGYMLSQSFQNILHHNNVQREVVTLISQTLVDTSHPDYLQPRIAIGPWFNSEKASQYRLMYNWSISEEPGRGYRRTVPSPPPLQLQELDSIRQLTGLGTIVIAAGGGGIPVTHDEKGDLVGIEAVVETEQVAYQLALQLNASILLMIIETDLKYLASNLSLHTARRLAPAELTQLLSSSAIESGSVRRQLTAAEQFLASGGQLALITTLPMLPAALLGESGLLLGDPSALNNLLS